MAYFNLFLFTVNSYTIESKEKPLHGILKLNLNPNAALRREQIEGERNKNFLHILTLPRAVPLGPETTLPDALFPPQQSKGLDASTGLEAQR